MDGRYLLLRRLLWGVIILGALAFIGYALYVYVNKPKEITGPSGLTPLSKEQKLKLLEDLAKATSSQPAVTETEKFKILNQAAKTSGSGGQTSGAASQSSVNEKVKLLESLQR